MKLAIITSHPIQYYAPWFRYLAQNPELLVKVFYLWDFGISNTIDPEFQQQFKWDVPLLEGYSYEFVPNVSKNPGTRHIWGLQNPSLSQRVLTYKPDAVLLIGYNYASLYRFLLQWNCDRVPLLFRGDSHCLVTRTDWKQGLRRRFISQVYKHFAAVLYVGKANYHYFRHHQVESQKLFFAPHAVDNQRFVSEADKAFDEARVWKQQLGIPQHHRVILFAGKYTAKKRPLDLLNAYSWANLPNVSLLLVGAGELETQLRRQADRHPHVYFAPFQNQAAMPRTYAAADLVVLPSYGVYETWGLAINEAMCLSRPIIVSSHVGCAQDLVHPGKNGLIFPAGDVSALAKSLQVACSDRQKLQQWGEESCRIISNYSYAQTTQGLMEALSALQARQNAKGKKFNLEP